MGESVPRPDPDASSSGDIKTEQSPAVKLFSMGELAQHNSEKDCWLLIDGKVYDVTRYIDEHPGGDEVMVNATAKDATEDFDDIGHTSDASEMLKDYLIGEIDPATIPVKEKVAPKFASPPRKESQSSSMTLTIVLKYLAVPVAIIVLAVTVRYLTKKTDS